MTDRSRIRPLEQKHAYKFGDLVRLSSTIPGSVLPLVTDRFQPGKPYRVVAVKEPMIYLMHPNIELNRAINFNPDTDVDKPRYGFIRNIGINLIEPMPN